MLSAISVDYIWSFTHGIVVLSSFGEASLFLNGKILEKFPNRPLGAGILRSGGDFFALKSSFFIKMNRNFGFRVQMGALIGV